ncbi:hypothetical protein [Enterococcus faecium]|uniref:hypothetical protein n=1 Tax=Enterococcus faecium TaxID=1352 RepID=UPI000DE88D2B|nr:hypothetical protein [Enterococcus faecium]
MIWTLSEVKALCADKKYEEAKSLIEKNKENLEEKYPIAQEFIELKQGTILHRFKHFFGITE